MERGKRPWGTYLSHLRLSDVGIVEIGSVQTHRRLVVVSERDYGAVELKIGSRDLSAPGLKAGHAFAAKSAKLLLPSSAC